MREQPLNDETLHPVLAELPVFAPDAELWPRIVAGAREAEGDAAASPLDRVRRGGGRRRRRDPHRGAATHGHQSPASRSPSKASANRRRSSANGTH